jgi:hypothetical protein
MELKKAWGPDGDGAHTVEVGILNLQVIVAQEGKLWVAQALEFDYAAGGETLEDLKARFEAGLYSTIQENLSMFGNIDKLLSTKPAAEYTLDLLKNPGLTKLIFSGKSTHKFIPPNATAELVFPYGQIDYFGPKSAQAGLAN